MKLKLRLTLSRILFAGIVFSSFVGFSLSSAADIFDGYNKTKVDSGLDLSHAHLDAKGKYGFLLLDDLTLSPADCPWWTLDSSLLLGNGFVFTGNSVDLVAQNYTGSKAMFYLSGGHEVPTQATLLMTELNNITFKNIQIFSSSSAPGFLKLGGSIIAKDPTQKGKLRVTASITGNNGTVSFVANSISVFTDGGAYGTSASGGGAYLDELGSLKISGNGADVLFQDNYAKAITESSLTDPNTGGAQATGGVMYVLYSSTVDLSDNFGKVVFKGNFASASGNVTDTTRTTISYAMGGAIFGLSSPTISLNANKGGVLFEGNYAEVLGLSKPGSTRPQFDTHAWGGAIYSSTGGISLKDNLGTLAFLSNYVSCNNATGARGGAIYMAISDVSDMSGSLTIAGNENVVFRNNYEKNLNLDGSYSYRLRSIYSAGGTLRMSAPEASSIIFYDSIYVGNENQTIYLGQNSLGDVVFSGLKTREDLAALDPSKTWSDAEINENRTSEVEGTTQVDGGRLIICDDAVYKSGLLVTGENKSATIMLQQGTLLVRDYTLFTAGSGLMSSGGGNTLVCNDIEMESKSILSFQLNRDQINSSSLMIAGNVVSSILTVNVLASAGVNLKTGQYQLLTITGTWSGWDAEQITLTGLSENKADIYWGGESNNILFFNYIAPLEPEVPEAELIPEGIGSIDSNSLWTTTRSLWSFVGTMRQQRGCVVDTKLKTAFWMTAVGDYFSQDAGAIAPGYDFSSTGYAMGVDYALVPSWNIGVGLSQTFGKQNVSRSLGKIDQDALMAALKVEKSFILNKSHSIELSFVGGYGGTSNSADVMSPSLPGEVLHGNWNDKAWLIDLQSSFTYQVVDKTFLDFYLGIQYTDAQQSRHASSSENVAYNVSHGSLSSLRLPVGVGLRHFSALLGHDLVTYARLGLIQDLHRDDLTAAVEASSRSWVAGGSQPGKTSYTGSVGAQFKMSSAWSLGVDYSIEAASESVDQTGRVSVMYRF